MADLFFRIRSFCIIWLKIRKTLKTEWVKFPCLKNTFYILYFERDFIAPFFCLIVFVSGEEFKGMKLSLWTSTSNHIKHGRIELAISPSCRQFVNLQAINSLPSTTESTVAWFPFPLPWDLLCIQWIVSNPCLHSVRRLQSKCSRGFPPLQSLTRARPFSIKHASGDRHKGVIRCWGACSVAELRK